MVRLLLLGALCVLFVTASVVSAQTSSSEFADESTLPPPPSTCTYDNLGYNPWQRWNAFAIANIGESSAPVSYFFTGRTASGASSYFRPIVAMAVGPSIHISGLGDNSTKWSATAGGEFFLSGGGTGFGGVEAVGGVTLEATTIHGDVNSAMGPAKLGAGGIGFATAVLGDVRAPSVVVGDGSTIYGTKFEGEVPSLSVELSQVTEYLEKMSGHYVTVPASSASFEYHGDATPSRVALNSGLNVIELTMAQINAMSKLIISGDAAGILLINAAGDLQTLTLPKFCFDEDCVVQPTTGRVLINFYEAETGFEISVTSNAYVSILAPRAVVSIHSGGLWGNLMVKKLGAQSVQGQVVNVYHLPWSVDSGCDNGNPEPQPGTPDGPECDASCAWVKMLGFDPWQQWNLFSLGDIGTSELPFGSIIQGRVAALGNAWFSAITLNSGDSDALEGSSSDSQNNWSATVSKNFTFLGGSIKNGGVEAGSSILVQSADVAGGLTSVNDAVSIGSTNNAAVIKGKARAALNVFFSPGSSAEGGVYVNPEGLALSADLEGVAEFFKKQSLDYSTANSAPNSVEFSPSEATPSDIIVNLHAGLNFISLTPSAFASLSRLQLNGDASGVLVINVKGKSVEIDSLDVYENGWTDAPKTGRVLANFYEATQLTINWGSGSFSIVAPLADVLYKSGMFAGNWVVGSVRSQWSGGTQINELPWQAPCSDASC